MTAKAHINSPSTMQQDRTNGPPGTTSIALKILDISLSTTRLRECIQVCSALKRFCCIRIATLVLRVRTALSPNSDCRVGCLHPQNDL